MNRFLLMGLLAFVVTLVVGFSASAKPATLCTVTPDPVTLSVDTQYVVIANGAIPNVLYEVTLPDAGDGPGTHNQDEARVWLGESDENGVINAVVPLDDGRITGGGTIYSLWLGTAKLKIQRWRAGGGSGSAGSGAILLTSCAFTIVDNL